MRKTDEEPMEAYMRRAYQKIRQLMLKAKIIPWDQCVLILGHRWAGHVARMKVYEPQRVVHMALGYKDYRYLKHFEGTIGSQGHHYSFHVWRWEKQFVDYYGLAWRDLAVDPECWKDSEFDWVH